jgi:putative ABC transport system permease protein
VDENGMLILQFCYAFFFLLSVHLLCVYQQVDYLANKDLGFSGEQVLEISYYRSPSDLKGKNARTKYMILYVTVEMKFIK